MPRRTLLRDPRSPATSPAQYRSGGSVSVLVRQAHGFEGLFRLTEGTKAKHLSIAKLEHPARGRFALDAAPLATVVDPTDEQGEVTDAERVVNLGSRDLKGIVE